MMICIKNFAIVILGASYMRKISDLLWSVVAISFSFIFSTSAFASYWCNGSASAIYCHPENSQGYWCTGSESAKYCQPQDAPGFWCTGSASAIYCSPPDRQGYWCIGSEYIYSCNN